MNLEQNLSASLVVSTIDKAVNTLTKPFVSHNDKIEAIKKFSLSGLQKPPQMDTLIVQEKAQTDFVRDQLLNGKKPQLLFRASRDGFSGKYHKKCDGKKDQIVIIKATIGRIFGGYHSQVLTKPVESFKIKDEKAFIFSLSDCKKFNLKKD